MRRAVVGQEKEREKEREKDLTVRVSFSVERVEKNFCPLRRTLGVTSVAC